VNGFCIWLTGIPSAGKTTVANRLQAYLERHTGLPSTVLDGDEVRENITIGLGFSDEDRNENVRRVGWMARKIVESGGIAIVSMISPYYKAREEAIEAMRPRCMEVYVKCSLKKAMERDPKELYIKAVRGEIERVTGWDAPYEEPLDNDYTIDMDDPHYDLDEETAAVVNLAIHYGWAPALQTSLFIGRWSPFHNGHKYIIDKEADGPISIGVRQTPLSEFDPWPVHKRIEMIQAVYPNAYVFAMPDIKSVNIGRLVGYEVNRHEVPEDVQGISATAVREMISAGNTDWMQFVPPEVAPHLQRMPQ